MNYRFNQRQYSAFGFKEQLKKAWEDNASSIRYVIQYTLYEDEMVGQLQERLIANQQEIGQLIGHFYGIKQDLANMFVEFIKLTLEAIKILKWKINVKSFRRTWHEKTDGLIRILNTLEKWDIRPLFYKQISTTEALIVSYIKDDEQEQVYYYNQLVIIGRSMSILVSENIINSHQKFFGQ